MSEPAQSLSSTAAHVDLNAALSSGHDLIVRRSESAEDGELRRRKDWQTFLVTLYGCAALTAASLVLVIVSRQPEVQRWAEGIVVAFVGAAVGYYGRGAPRAHD